MNALRRVVDGERTDDPVLFALADAQKRYKIPLELLEKLVHGTEMDAAIAGLAVSPAGGASASCSTRPSISFTTTAITLHQWWGWCAFASSAIAIRVRRSWRKKWEWRFNSPTFCAT